MCMCVSYAISSAKIAASAFPRVDRGIIVRSVQVGSFNPRLGAPIGATVRNHLMCTEQPQENVEHPYTNTETLESSTKKTGLLESSFALLGLSLTGITNPNRSTESRWRGRKDISHGHVQPHLMHPCDSPALPLPHSCWCLAPPPAASMFPIRLLPPPLHGR